MSLMLSPVQVFFARIACSFVAIAGWDYATGAAVGFDFEWGIYAFTVGVTSVLAAMELRHGLRSRKIAVIDLPALVQTRTFWQVVGIYAVVFLLIAWMNLNSATGHPLRLVGVFVWIVFLYLSTAGGKKSIDESPYVRYPRLRWPRSS